MSGTMRIALIELIFTISPLLRCTISGRTARVTRMSPLRLVSMMLDQSSALAEVEAGATADIVARIVDQDVDRPERRWNEVGQIIDPGTIGDVELQGCRPVTQVLCEFGCTCEVEVGEHNAVPGFHELLGDRAADSAGGTGDQGISFGVRHGGIPSSGLVFQPLGIQLRGHAREPTLRLS